MESFVIIATSRFLGRGEPVMEVLGEERAINEAMRVFREGAMHKVIVVNEALTIIFKDIRICKCTNVQKELSPSGGIVYVERCMDCGIVIDHLGYLRHKPSEESEAVKDVGMDRGGTLLVGAAPTGATT